MRLRTVILLLASLLFIDLLIVLGIWVWKSRKPDPIKPPSEVEAAFSETTLSDEGESPMPTPAPTARFDFAPILLDEVAASVTGVTIDSPRDGEAVPRRFTVTGKSGPLPAGQRLMLVVDSGRGVYSPKMPPLEISDNQWSGSCNEFGAPTGGSFALCVFQVSEPGVNQITQWHTQGKATGKYPPFRQSLPGGRELARIQLRVARN